MLSFTSKPHAFLCGFLAAMLMAAVSTLQPSQAQIYQSQETLKANTRLVIVDVVATDSHGQPINDLEARDFTILEEGRPQTISHFSFQHPGAGPGVVPRALPPNVVSNAPSFASNTLNVIVFDAVNGEFASQAYAKDQLVKFFSTATLQQPVALFALETRTRLLHDFTTDASALKTVLEKYKPPVQMASTESFTARESAFSNKGDYHTDDRNIDTTLNQLNALAKTLAGYPGRKNLIWVSESFPLDLFPDDILQSSTSWEDTKTAGEGPQPLQTMRQGEAFTDYAALVKKLADSMMNAQIAIYAVDAAGLGKNDHLASIHTANDLADRTGGEAFHNTNDLGGSMQASLNDGATYYTLEYYPDNKKWDGQFRGIQVKVRRPGVRLRHRVGYYALDPQKAAKEDADRITEDFSRSLQVDAPSVTAIRFQAGVLPPSGQTGDKLVVNFAVDPRTVHFDRSADGMEHARVSCTVWAYGSNKDKPIMSPGDTSKADLKPEVYAQVMKAYFPCKQELELRPGTYTLRLGVLDRNSNQMGTTTAAVTVH